MKSKKHGEFETLISTKKLTIAESFPNTWIVAFDKSVGSYYVTGVVRDESGKRRTISLHRLVMGFPKGLYVDHANHDTFDNTDNNLRVVTNSENLQNRTGATKSSKSGIRGVHWAKRLGKWQAQVRVNGRAKHVGFFKNITDAEAAVKIARTKYLPFSFENINKVVN